MTKNTPSKSLWPKRLLIVEDDPGYRALLTLRLQKAGFDVTTAEGGDAAKALFLKSPVPPVVSDLVMPKEVDSPCSIS